MKAVVQRVLDSRVVVDGAVVGEIGAGLMVLVGFGEGDTEALLEPFANKITQLRIFADEEGKFQKSVKDVGGGILLVPQFTLYADTSRGRRPGFEGALKPELAKELFEKLISITQNISELKVQYGKFGAHMQVALVNDGPVTILL
jgi:D-tyrosyl-tRNA(Tyr) deacylase